MEARKYMFNKNMKNVPIDDDVDINEIAELTDGYSGADIDEICDQAKEGPLQKYIETDVLEKIKKEDLLRAINKVRPMVSSKEIENFEKYAGIDMNISNNHQEITKEENKDIEELKIGFLKKDKTFTRSFTYR